MAYRSIFFLAFFIIACGTPNTPTGIHIDRDVKLVLIKSKNINFYDFALQEFEPELALDFLKFGKSVGKLVVKKREICFINDCAPKWGASRAFFGNVGYDTLFEEILLKKDIFDGIGKRIAANGVVVQQFEFGGNKFYYEHSTNRVYFKNITANIIVSIEDYAE